MPYPDTTPPPCSNCTHPYGNHTGRSLYNGRIVGYHVDGPYADRYDPKFIKYGKACDYRLDFHHTCGCPEWTMLFNNGRWTQKQIEAGLHEQTPPVINTLRKV